MTDVSKMIATFRAQNPVETIGKTDKEVADLMLSKKGGLSYAEASALMEAFSGDPEPVGDLTSFKTKGQAAPEEDPLAKYMPSAREGVPSPKSNKAGIIAGLTAGIGAVTYFLTRGKVKPATIGKAALGVGAAVTVGATMASCSSEPDIYVNEENNFNFNFDFGPIVDKLNKLIEQNSEFKDIYYAMLDHIQKIEEEQAENNAQIKIILNEILETLNGIKDANDNRAIILEKILAAIAEGNTQNLEFFNKILETLAKMDAGNEDVISFLEKILNEITSGNAQSSVLLNTIIEALGNIEKGDDSKLELLKQIYNEVKSGNAKNETLLNTIIEALGNIEKGDDSKLELLKQIYNEVKSGNAKNETLLNTIIEALGNIEKGDDSKLELLKQIYNEVKSGNIQNAAAYNNIIEILSKLDKNDTDKMDVLNKILTEVQKGNTQNSEAYNNLLTLWNSIKDGNDSRNKVLDKILTEIQNGNTQNLTAFNDILVSLSELKDENSQNTAAIVDVIIGMWDAIATGNKETIEILNKLLESNASNNKELMDLINKLFNDSQISADERTDKIIEAINNVAEMVKNLEATVAATGDAISNAIAGLSTQLDALLKAYQEGNKTSQDVLAELQTIITKLTTGNELSSTTNTLLEELLKKADQIISSGGDVNDYTDILNQILAAINDVVAGIEDIKIGIGENNADITAALEEIIKNQNVQTDALNKFAEQSTANQEKLIAQGETIIAELQKLGVNLDNGILEVVNTIKDSNAALAAQVAALAEALGLKMDDNAQAIINTINGLKPNIEAIENAIKNLIDATNNGKLDLTTTNNLIQTVINLLSAQDNPSFDLSEITSMLTTTNALLQKLLDKDTSNDPTAILDALNKMMEILKNLQVGGGSTVDLTTTNNLIQTCITQLSQLVAAQSTSSDIMASVTNLGTQLTEVIASLQTGNVTTDEINAKLDAIMDAINELSAKAG